MSTSKLSNKTYKVEKDGVVSMIHARLMAPYISPTEDLAKIPTPQLDFEIVDDLLEDEDDAPRKVRHRKDHSAREVKEILDAGYRKTKGQGKRKWLFKVAWKGEKGRSSWETEEYIPRNMVTNYYLANPMKEAEREGKKGSRKRKRASTTDGSEHQL